MNLNRNYSRTATLCPGCRHWTDWQRIPGENAAGRSKYDKPYQCAECGRQLRHRVQEHYISKEQKEHQQELSRK